MKILLVDDETLTREALAMLLRHAGREDYGPQAQVLEAASADEGLAVLDRHREKPPNLILLDFFLPDGTGGEVVGRFVAAAPTTPVVVISSANDGKDAAAVLSCGAVGYLPKSASFACLRQLVTLARSGDLRHQFALFGREGVASMPQVQGGASAAGASAAGAVPLTARQREIARLVARGRTNKEIARALGVQEATVKAHLRMILRQNGFRNRTQLAVYETGGGNPSSPSPPASVAGGWATLALPVPPVRAASHATVPDGQQAHAPRGGPDWAGPLFPWHDESDPYWMAPF